MCPVRQKKLQRAISETKIKTFDTQMTYQAKSLHRMKVKEVSL